MLRLGIVCMTPAPPSTIVVSFGTRVIRIPSVIPKTMAITLRRIRVEYGPMSLQVLLSNAFVFVQRVVAIYLIYSLVSSVSVHWLDMADSSEPRVTSPTNLLMFINNWNHAKWCVIHHNNCIFSRSRVK